MSGGSHSKKYQAELVCPECGNVAFIWRRMGKSKKSGHTKHMWCPVCQEITGHIERRS